MTGCGMYCRYCILQAYFGNRVQTVFDNFEDLEIEVTQKMARHKRVVRFGTGEFGDSLFQEPVLGLSARIARVLAPFPNALIEFKTKSTRIDTLDKIDNPSRVIIGFSMNSERMISLHEIGTASLSERLHAARRCEEMGFHVAFHFDPMFYYEGWEKEYRATVKSIYSAINNPSHIAWCSLGGFRSMPSLKTLLKSQGKHLPLFTGEMILGQDGKLRYVRPVRTAMYRELDDEFRRHDPFCTVYLCMESPEVWRDSGMENRIPQGLVTYLDKRAEQILGIQQNDMEAE